MEFRLIFRVIANTHSGYCSGGECEEYDMSDDKKYGDKRTDIIIILDNDDNHILYKSLALKNLNQGDVLFEGDELFDELAELYNDSENEWGGSGYCGNQSDKFAKHTINKVLYAAIFIRYVDDDK